MIINRNILIVDDTLSTRETLAAHLTAQGYNLAFAGDGLEAFRKIVESPPAVKGRSAAEHIYSLTSLI